MRHARKTAKSARKQMVPRVVHVECSTVTGYRWLVRNLVGAAEQTPDGFRVVDEGKWAELLRAAGGLEEIAVAK